MFNLFYKRYKLEVLRKGKWIDLSSLKKYEKVLLFILCMLWIFFVVLAIKEEYVFAFIALLIVLIIIGVLKCLQNRPKEQKRYIKEELEPYVNERRKGMISLLQEFGIDEFDKQKIECIIEKARAQKNEYDIWKDIKNFLGTTVQYILVPFITIALTGYLKKTEMYTAIKIVFLIYVCCLLLKLLVYSLAENINLFLNMENDKLQSLINDLEDILLFSSSVNMYDEMTVYMDENNNILFNNIDD